MKKLFLSIAVLFYGLLAISQNPQLLKDVYPGNTGSGIQQIVKTSNYTFFNAEDDDLDIDRGLYRTDGTPGGTIKLNLTYPTYISTKAEKLTALGDKVVFAGDNFANYGEIWVSDGTQGGTIAIERFQPTASGVLPVTELKTMGTNVFYSVVDGNNHAVLKKTDGTPGGTSVVYDFSAFSGIPQVVYLTPVNNILYFVVYDAGGTGVDQLWRSDGTTGGTYMLMNFGSDQYLASFLMPAGNNIYAMIVKPGTGNVLWKSDGTVAGTVSVKTIGTSGNNNYPHNAAIGSTLYFAGLDGNGKELWKTDGTEAGTIMVQNINAGAASSNPTLLTALNNNLYFYADGGIHGNELWKYDGASASEVIDIYPGSTGSKPVSNSSFQLGFVESNGTIVFNAANDATGQELWITDGTAANTKKIKDINPLGASNPSALTPGNPVYFSANNGVNGAEIFKYDNSEGISGLNKIYVNDNSTTGDVLTTAVGNNTNAGTKTAPVSTMTYALSIAQAGDTIIVDSGTYEEQLTIDKGITIIGAGQELTSVLKPTVTVAPPGPFTEQGVIQTEQNIGDVFIENMSITGGTDITPVIMQSGGGVKDCKLQNGNQGVFIRIESAIKTTVVENNIISAEYIGVNFQGSGLTASLINNTISVANQGFSAGIFTGLDFGPITQLTVTGNSISNYATYGFLANSINSNITQNSIVGNGPAFSTNTLLQATCNWYGSSDAEIIKSKIVGNVNYGPWLVNGTDNDPATLGFQAVPDSCTGRQNKFYVNDNSQTGDLFTTAVGNDANNGFSTTPFATIDYAITIAQAGDTIFVDAGIHILPNIGITKALTFLGPNYQTTPNNPIDKKLANGARNAEAIVTGSTISILSNNLSFVGFTFDPGDKFAFVLSNSTTTNNDFGNFFYSKNILKIRTTTNNSQFSIIGKFVTSPALPVTSGYNILDNRFEKISTAIGSTLQFSYIKDIMVTDNSFVASGSIIRSQQTALLGATGIVDTFIFSNNIIEDASTVIGGNRIAGALILANKLHNIDRAFSNNNNMPESSNIEFNNNELGNDLGTPFMLYNRTGTSLAGTSNIFKVENNIFTGASTVSANQLFASMNFTINNSVLNPSIIIQGNKLTFSGDFSSQDNQFFRPITVRGNIGNLTLDKNEILLNNSGSLLPFNPTVLLPDNPAITIGTDVGTFAYLKANSTINISNNKINGFQNSIAFYDASNGRDSYTGYGNVPEGVSININNNSFTGDVLSINNGTQSQDVNASCNWYGSAAVQDFINKLTLPTVDFLPWSTNGTDDEAITGFQPLPDICNGTPVAIALDNSTNVSCNSANNGTINITVSNGLAPYSFLWTNSDNPEFNSSSEDLVNLGSGTYQLLLTDSNGSTASLSGIVISEPDLLTVSASGIENICFGASEGTAFVLADGGVPPYSYFWSNNETTDEISNLSAGTYSVTVTDANGCITNASYEVTQPTLLTATIANNSTICSNNATVTAYAGTPDYTYLWSNGATTDSINNVPIGTYTVTVTDTNGCSTTASINLTVGEAFNPSASVTNVNCFGESNGAITITNANGTAPFTFSQDGGTFLTGTLPYSINNLSAGTFEIAVKDSNGCTGFVTKTVTQPALLSATIITVQSTCFGQSTGSISVATAGGSGALSYSWTGAGSYTSSQKNISGLAAGSYSLTVMDNNGCTALLNVVVPNSNPITVSETITNVSCRGSLTGAISLTVSGGSGSGFAYSWTGSTIATSEDISNLGAGTNYKVTITDIGSGCTVSKSYIITQPASNLAISTSKTNSTGCNSLGTITVTGSGGTPGYTYSINGTNYQVANTFPGLLAGSYTAWVKDANGCTKSSASISITDNGTDAYESNNSKNQAKLISIGTTINARIALATDIADWFMFTTPAGNGNYKLNLSHQTVNYTFNMYPTGNNVAALVPSGSTPTSKQYALTGGATYYVQITGASSYNCYDLSILPVASSAKYAPNATKVIVTNELSVKAYPNPHEGLFNLAIKSPEDGTARIHLFTILGQILATRDVSIEKGQNTIVQFSDVGRGMILYHITIGSQEVNGKVFGKD